MSDRPKKLFESTHVGLFDIDGVLRGMTSSLERWPLLQPLPSYGRDRDGAKSHRHQALLMLHGVKHVVIRGRGGPGALVAVAVVVGGAAGPAATRAHLTNRPGTRPGPGSPPHTQRS